MPKCQLARAVAANMPNLSQSASLLATQKGHGEPWPFLSCCPRIGEKRQARVAGHLQDHRRDHEARRFSATVPSARSVSPCPRSVASMQTIETICSGAIETETV